MKSTIRRSITSAALVVLLAIVAVVSIQGGQSAAGQPRNCNRPLPDPIATFDVPSGEPVLTRDGCWIFSVIVAEEGIETRNGIAALRRTESGVELHRFLSLPIPRLGGPYTPVVVGIALTHDDKLLVVSHNRRITFIDVAKMTSGQSEPVLGVLEGPRLSISWGVVISSDDKYAFAAQQGTASVLMVDLDTIRKGVFDQSALVGLIPTAQQATTPLLSPDGRYLFTTTLRPPDVVNATPPCAGTKQPEGAVQVIDVQRARTDPASATIGFAHPAGCSPISGTLSPDGNRLTTVAPGRAVDPKLSALDSAIVAFDTRPVREGKEPAFIAKVPVPPQVIRILDGGDKLFLAFLYGGPNKPTPVNITVLDAAKLAAGKAAILGTLPTPAFALALSSDRRTLFVSTDGWRRLKVIDLQRVALEPVKN